MTIDLHTRLWTSTEQFGPPVAAQMRRRKIDAWEDHSADPDDHRQAMTPVTAAVLLGFESTLLGGSIPHQQIADYTRRDPDRLLGFAGIDPKATISPTQSLEQAIELGLVGVTVNPAAAGFHPTDTRAMALFEACQHHQMPVLIECGTVMAREARMEFARPALFDEVMREFPDLRLVLGTFGDPWVDEGVALLAKHPNVFADISGFTARPWQLFNALLTAHQLGTMDQVLFGSNFPFVSPEQAIKTIYSVNTLTQGTQLPSVPREQLRSVVERDTIKVLGLKQTKPSVTESGVPSDPATNSKPEETKAAEQEASS